MNRWNNARIGMKKGFREILENPTCGASRVRTGDPLLAKQMRYQLRHSPIYYLIMQSMAQRSQCKHCSSPRY